MPVKAVPPRIYPLVCVAIALLVLIGCVPPTPPATPTATPAAAFVDRSVLTNEPCGPPCWYGLELGKTTKLEALAKAKALSFIDPTLLGETSANYWDKAHPAGIPAILHPFNCRQPAGRVCVEFVFVDDVLRELFLSPNFRVTFSEVVTSLGAPEYVRYVPNGSASGVLIALVWKQRGVMVDYASVQTIPTRDRGSEIRSGKGIDPNLPVEGIEYLLPEDGSLFDVPQKGVDYPWSGFAPP